MKYILQGIGDYIKDCWHDWLIHKLVRMYDDKYIKDDWLWKEGNLWHYVHQRKIGNKVKKKNNKE